MAASVLHELRTGISFPQVRTDNVVFQLHTQVTSVLLIGSCLLVMASTLIDHPIQCTTGKEIPEEVMNTYCWIHSTFTLPDRFYERDNLPEAHPGVGNQLPEEEERYHTYYQWVYLTLFFHAVMFWFPSRIWKWAEGQEIDKIVRKVFVDEKTLIVKISDKRMPLPRKGEERFKDFDDSVARLAKWFVKYSVHTNKFKVYFGRFVFCEFLTVLNLASHILLMHFFLGNVFATFGFKLWATAEMSVEDRDDIFNMIFPKAGKCTFQRMGPSGTIQIQDGLCVLPVNIINEKIYIFFWYWLSILSVVTLFWIIYRVLTSFIVSFRAWELRSRLHNWASKIEVNGINKKLDAFQWFFLSQLGKNLDPRVFQAILNEIDGIPCLDKSVESKCRCFS